jgi:hypothetical protein
MNRIFAIGLLFLCANINLSIAQTIDLSSVDEFFKVTSTLKEGKEISMEQWKAFDSSGSYDRYVKRKDQFVLNTIKNTINIVFGKDTFAKKDSILSITQEEMKTDPKKMFKRGILNNYLNINTKYESIKSFRENYDFNSLVEKAKQRLRSFLGLSLDTTTQFKPVYFLFITADGKNTEDAIYVDFNLIYKETEKQRIDFLAHEFFHNYREKYENHNFNYKNYMNHCVDMIQNEGIADLIDKTEGYKKYFTDTGESPEITEIWENLYHQAPNDLERLQNLMLKYSKNDMSEKDMENELDDIIRFNGHPIGLFMAGHIVSAGYKNELLISFYNPYEFFNLYNKAAKKQHIFQLSNEFMDYLKGLTKEYYR